MKKYFSLSENCTHIATICAETNDELNEKIKIACSEHFDEEVAINEFLEIEKFNHEEDFFFISFNDDVIETINIIESTLY
jgi:hypothetical protein